MDDLQKPIDIGCCFHCREPMWMTAATHQTYQRNGQAFYCIHGHKQVFVRGKTDLELAQEELARERRARQRAEQRVAEAHDQAEHERRRAMGYKGHSTRLANRAKAGFCPCCNRHFKQLAAHMANKHPAFAPPHLNGEPALEGASP